MFVMVKCQRAHSEMAAGSTAVPLRAPLANEVPCKRAPPSQLQPTLCMPPPPQMTLASGAAFAHALARWEAVAHGDMGPWEWGHICGSHSS